MLSTQNVFTNNNVKSENLMRYRIIPSINESKGYIVYIHGFGGSSNAFKKQFSTFEKDYTQVCIDMYGHGLTRDISLTKFKESDFSFIAKAIIDVLDYEGIEKAHLIGLSVGTCITRVVAEIDPKRVASLIWAGGVIKYNWKSKALFKIGNATVGFTPYMLLYTIFATLMMPSRNHKRSREMFINEAKKMGKKEFVAWFKTVQEFNDIYTLEKFKQIRVPKLFISGEQDHMFLPWLKKYEAIDINTRLHVIPNCGHISNIDAYEEFNTTTLNFIRFIFS